MVIPYSLRCLLPSSFLFRRSSIFGRWPTQWKNGWFIWLRGGVSRFRCSYVVLTHILTLMTDIFKNCVVKNDSTVPLFVAQNAPRLESPNGRVWWVANSPAFSGIYLWRSAFRMRPFSVWASLWTRANTRRCRKMAILNFWGVRLICMRSCGFQMFGKVGGTENLCWKFYPACDVARNTWCRLQLRHNCPWPPSMNLESLTRPTLTLQNLKRWKA